MNSNMALNIRKVSIVAAVLAIVAAENFASAAFLIKSSSSSSSIRQHVDHSQQSIDSHRRFGRSLLESDSLPVRRGRLASTAIRGGGKDNTEELIDCGGAAANLFGNLRIPASLIAGASLGQAFALPFLETDVAKVAFAKRLYAFSLMTTLGSMLLVVIIGTISMNDIAFCPSRHSKNVGSYIEENYALEWMLVRTSFFYGAFAFVGATIFRSWISVSCPVVATGIMGILTSTSIICMSFVLGKTRRHVDSMSLREVTARFAEEVVAKTKANPLFGVGVTGWTATVAYLLVKLPHIYMYIMRHSV